MNLSIKQIYTGVNDSYIHNIFKDIFNYGTATHTSLNVYTLATELINERVAILDGKSGDFGHAWLCDGLRKYMYCQFDNNGNWTNTLISYRFYMKWGLLSTGEGNGWYKLDNLDPTIYDFDQALDMTYNIKPI